MASLILLVVAAAWAAVLIPPLLRSRVENRPNSSVSDFRNQLSSLQRAMPSRTVSMRGMARPLAPSPLARPAATGRPVLRSGVRTHGAGTTRSAGQQAAVRAPAPARLADASLRRKSYEPGTRSRHAAAHKISDRAAMKRRRANVLFVLVLVTACSVFLAVTTKATPMAWVAGLAGLALCAYVFVLGQSRGRELAPLPHLERRREPAPRRDDVDDVEMWGGHNARQRDHAASRPREPGVTRQREHGRPDRRGASRRRVADRFTAAV